MYMLIAAFDLRRIIVVINKSTSSTAIESGRPATSAIGRQIQCDHTTAGGRTLSYAHSTQNVVWNVEDISQHLHHLLGVHMKELLCFTIGLVVGAVLMKKTHAIHELQKELEREKFRNNPPSGSEQR